MGEGVHTASGQDSVISVGAEVIQPLTVQGLVCAQYFFFLQMFGCCSMAMSFITNCNNFEVNSFLLSYFLFSLVSEHVESCHLPRVFTRL